MVQDQSEKRTEKTLAKAADDANKLIRSNFGEGVEE
jgi:hypothetical protein